MVFTAIYSLQIACKLTIFVCLSIINKHCCCVLNCNSSDYQLAKWLDDVCPQEGKSRRECICCQPPYKLLAFPTEKKDAELRKSWITLVNRVGSKNKMWEPSKYSTRICSLHFVDGSPYPVENIVEYRCNRRKERGKSLLLSRNYLWCHLVYQAPFQLMLLSYRTITRFINGGNLVMWISITMWLWTVSKKVVMILWWRRRRGRH